MSSPAAQRNKGPILDIVKDLITRNRLRDSESEKLHVLEIASGTGEHAAFFASELSNVVVQPSDILTNELRISIEVHLSLRSLY
jgi:ubiquinone/menaquinone biosynthesis C-methylase UbiE